MLYILYFFSSRHCFSCSINWGRRRCGLICARFVLTQFHTVVVQWSNSSHAHDWSYVTSAWTPSSIYSYSVMHLHTKWEYANKRLTQTDVCECVVPFVRRYLMRLAWLTCVCADKLPDAADTGHRDRKRKQLISTWNLQPQKVPRIWLCFQRLKRESTQAHWKNMPLATFRQHITLLFAQFTLFLVLWQWDESWMMTTIFCRAALDESNSFQN